MIRLVLKYVKDNSPNATILEKISQQPYLQGQSLREMIVDYEKSYFRLTYIFVVLCPIIDKLCCCGSVVNKRIGKIITNVFCTPPHHLFFLPGLPPIEGIDGLHHFTTFTQTVV